MKTTIAAVFFILLAAGTFGQAGEEAEYKQLKTNNIGFGTGMVHIINESEWAPALHLHYSKCIDRKQRFSIGTGMDLLFGDHKHTSVSLAVEYSPLPGLSIGYGPGIEFPLGDVPEIESSTGTDPEIEAPDGITEDHGVQFCQHIELAYEFDLDFMQIGPMVEYEFSGDDRHIMLGLHAGISF